MENQSLEGALEQADTNTFEGGIVFCLARLDGVC